ncbi:2-oxo acid dehydrogenase subunit E2 [Roseobacteraceae bacterium NS-SX3]
MSQLIEVRVPDIGDFAEVPVIEIPVSTGDTLSEDDTVIVLESDKATLDVPSPAAGRVAEIRLAPGDLVSEGSVVLLLEPAAGAAAPAPAPAPEPVADTPPPQPVQEAAPKPQPAIATPEQGRPVYASPSVRRYARTLGVPAAEVTGTGPKGRVLKTDIEAFVKKKLTAPEAPAAGALPAGLPDWPQVDFAQFGPVEREPLSRIARISGPALARNALVIPHVCNFDKADVTDLDNFRKELNAEARPEQTKITLLAFTVKAVVAALKAHPKFNSSLDGADLLLKRYWNIGVAADTPEGLVVPVIKAAEQKGLREIAQEMAYLAAEAREGRLKAADMQGASFTISSLGGIGGTGFTPIINAPEVAILGMTRAEIQPVWDGSAFQPRLIQPLSLSWDHRAVDGVAAARFLREVARLLADFRRVAL